MALSCYVFARAVGERHGLVVRWGFLRIQNSLARGLLCIPEHLRSQDAPPNSLRTIERLGVSSCCPALVKPHPHACINSELRAPGQAVSLGPAEEAEPAFSDTVTCPW